jgi:D-3-phosphoglycerate dehydrogenase
MSGFRVAMSADFKKPDGSPSFPEFDLSPLENHPDVDLFYLQPEDVISARQLADVDALILLTARVDANSLPPGGRLAMVARFGVGYDNVDVAACDAADIALVITPDGVRRPVAVSILTLIFALAGKLFVKDRLARLGPQGWAQKTNHNGIGLVGLTLGSLGVGNIGAELFRIAKPFDLNFVAYDPFADPALAVDLGIKLVDLEELFRTSDFLSVNCPLSAETHHLVNAERLALMKSTAFLINTARGPIVDQAALTEALQLRRIAGAGIDVFEQEPPDKDDPLLALDNVILSPHALCWTDQIFAGNGAADVRAVLDVMAGRVPTGIVNRDIAKSSSWRARLNAYVERFGEGGLGT